MPRSRGQDRAPPRTGAGGAAAVRPWTLVPAELYVLIPAGDAYCYLAPRAAVDDLALEALLVAPPVRTFTLTCDVLGGVHDVRCYEADEGSTLLEVAAIEHAALRTFPLPLALIYFERGIHPPADAEARWAELARIHSNRRSSSTCSSPRPRTTSSSRTAALRSGSVVARDGRTVPDRRQAAGIRQKLGLDDPCCHACRM